jgi:type II secretory pathway pseudopilin PulG
MKKTFYRVGKADAASGFSMIELVFAIGVLSVAVVGGLAMVVFGVARNGSSRMDTTATNVAQTVLEDIATSIPTGNPTMNITDCAGNILVVQTAVGGAGLKLDGSGDIDFQQPAVGGYQMNYTVCGNNGLRATYDVRWRVEAAGGSAWGKLVTVAARQPLSVQNGQMMFVPPVTLRTIVGM